jgi:hypothetical protein
MSARAGNRRFWLLSALRAHTKAPYKTTLLWETLRPHNRFGRARTDGDVADVPQVAGEGLTERREGLQFRFDKFRLNKSDTIQIQTESIQFRFRQGFDRGRPRRARSSRTRRCPRHRGGPAGLCINDGALSFVTAVCCRDIDRGSQYKRE